MAFFIGYIDCENCGRTYDGALGNCPHCDAYNCNPDVRAFRFIYPVGPVLEAIYSVYAFVGLNLIATIIQMIYLAIFSASYTGDPQNLSEAFRNYIYEPANLAVVQYVTYGLLGVGACLLFFHHWKPFLQKYKWQNIYWAPIAVAGIYAFNIIYNLILNAAGVQISDNANQSAVVDLVNYNPLLAFIFLGLIGPLVEEFSYRLGLFTFLKRFNLVVAYIFAGLIFGFIHFDFSSITSPNEWLNLPSYIIPGLLLCLAYDRGGLMASYMAHAFNNVMSVIAITMS